MSTRINTNTTAFDASVNLSKNSAAQATDIQRLSSGLRINSAADDPSGYVLSQSLQAQSGSITQATNNTNDAINVVKTAEGALTQVQALLVNIRQTIVQAANVGTNNSTALTADAQAVADSVASINRIASTTQFNGKNLLDGSASAGGAGVTAGAATTTATNSQVATLGVTNNAAKYGTTAVIGATVTYNAAKSAAYTVNGDGTNAISSASTFTGTLKVNGTSINLGSTGQTLDQVNAALETSGSTYQASLSNGALKFTDSGTGASAGASSFDVSNLKYTPTATSTTNIAVSTGTLAEGNIASVTVTKPGVGGTAYTSDKVVTNADGTNTFGFSTGTLKGLQLSSNASATSLPVVSGTGTAVPAGSNGLAIVTQAKTYGAAAIASANVTYTAATPSSITSTSTVTTGDTFSGSLKVNGATVALTSNTTTAAQLQAAIRTATGSSTITATIAGSKLVLTDPSGAAVTADTSALHNWTTTTDDGAIASPAASTNGVVASATVNGVKSTSSAVSGANTTFSFSGNALDGLEIAITSTALVANASNEGTFAATADAPPAAVGTLSATADKVTAGNALQFQIGSNQGQTVAVSIGSTKADSVGAFTNTSSGKSFNLSDLGSNGALDLTDVTGKSQQDALAVIDQAISDISAASEKLGSTQANVLQSNINSLAVSQSNNDSSLSTVRDTDLAATVVDYTKNQILVQAGTS
ncbi:MAG: flagellin, partial [Janthinobacterium lividum]